MKRIILSATALLIVTIAACSPAPTPTPTPVPIPENALLAAKAAAAPKDAADAAWSKAPPLVMTTKGRGEIEGQNLKVTARALYTADELYLLFTWADSEMSIVKGAWKLDGGKWTNQKGDEDRIAILWEITPIKDFASKGCAIACHNKPGSDKPITMGTNSATEKGDLWHWKAYRTNPLGFADDGFLVLDNPAKEESGRKSDPGGGGDTRNENKEKDKPTLMQDPAKKPTAAGFLLKDEAVEIKDYSAFKSGDIVPWRILSRPTESRGDIQAVGVWKDSAWTVLLSRKLKTATDDDLVFDPGKTYNFGVAVWNNAGEQDKYGSGPLVLMFGK